MPSAKFLHLAAGLVFIAVLASILFSLSVLTAQNPRPAEISLRIIVVSSLAEAQQILARLKNGEDFAFLAKAKSTDPTADDGGYMGKLDPKTLRPELRDALRDLHHSSDLAWCQRPSGYAILKVLAVAENPAPTNLTPAAILPIAATCIWWHSLVARKSLLFLPCERSRQRLVAAATPLGKRFPEPAKWICGFSCHPRHTPAWGVPR